MTAKGKSACRVTAKGQSTFVSAGDSTGRAGVRGGKRIVPERRVSLKARNVHEDKLHDSSLK
jgi:hypothetical protein